MSNEYFEFENPFIPGTLVRAEEVNEVFAGVEAGFDGLKVQIDRTVRLPVGSSGDLTLATPSNRALRVIGFDVDGNIQLRSSFAYVGDWLTATQYKMNSVFRDPTSKNLYAVQVDHQSTTIAADLSSSKILLAVNVADVVDAQMAAQQAATDADSSATASQNSATDSATSASQSLGFRNEAEGFRDEAETFSLTAINAPGTSATSVTSHTLDFTTPKVFAIQPGKEFVTGQFVIIANTAAPSNYLVGQVLTNNKITGTLTVDVIAFDGSGTFADWTIALTSVSTQGVVIVTRSDDVFYRVVLAESAGNTLIRGQNGTQDLEYNPFTGVLRSVTFSGLLAGNANTATALETPRNINGTAFNGSANITTALWGTTRNISIGNTTRSVDGSANYSWSLADIGAPATDGTGATGTWSINISGNASTAGSAGSAGSATNATNATNVNVTTTAANANYALVFSPSQTTGQKSLLMDSSGGTYNPASNTADLNITGSASYATNSGNAATVTNGVYNNGGTYGINITGNAGSANTAAACSGNSATATALTTASGSAPSYSARAWVNFDGTNDTIRGSGNVSSVASGTEGSGIHIVNFTAAMPDANYAMCVTAGSTAGAVTDYGAPSFTAPTTASCKISTGNFSGYIDVPYVHFVAFR